jgi:predicted PhzF superfamily epimerase YddE/YHI9
MPLDLYQVDAFTDRAFAGNPAAVCLLPEPRAAEWMQHVAREMNLSETAFLQPRGTDYDLRWFTPATEVELCGHATLASAHVLWETGRLDPGEPARFHTLSGLLTAERRPGPPGETDWIELDFPAKPAAEVALPPGLAAAIGAEPVFAGKSRFDYLLELGSEAEVRAVTPDFGRLRQVPVRGVIVTARAAQGLFDFVSRFFAPGSGVDEDPVTGSAHCTLGPFWASRLGKEELLAYQASARGGVIRVRLAGDRVKLAGQAVTVLRGHLLS